MGGITLEAQRADPRQPGASEGRASPRGPRHPMNSRALQGRHNRHDARKSVNQPTAARHRRRNYNAHDPRPNHDPPDRLFPHPGTRRWRVIILCVQPRTPWRRAPAIPSVTPLGGLRKNQSAPEAARAA